MPADLLQQLPLLVSESGGLIGFAAFLFKGSEKGKKPLLEGAGAASVEAGAALFELVVSEGTEAGGTIGDVPTLGSGAGTGSGTFSAKTGFPASDPTMAAKTIIAACRTAMSLSRLSPIASSSTKEVGGRPRAP